ncbi:hypothetical protein GF327_01290 [Candidatus Woesearchaeota archaeon]|nr:hypothetical protein [Candidatus Woesearchaeota archaeon]
MILVLLSVFVSADLTGKIICLDPGHGGTDPGAVNGDLLEKDINLDISFLLKDMLLVRNSQVVMTRTTTYESLGNSDRAYICNDAGADLLISIHTNSVEDPNYDGTYMYWFKKEDRALASVMQPIMYNELGDYEGQPVTYYGIPDFIDFGTDRFASGTLMRSDMPAVITEPVFMSNPTEAQWLSSAGSERRTQIAHAHYLGILSYYGIPLDPVCGDDTLNQESEECDGFDLGWNTCISLGFDDGTLSCTEDCTFDTTSCTTSGPECGNGICEGNGEDCFSCESDCACFGKDCSFGCCGDGVEQNMDSKKCNII